MRRETIFISSGDNAACAAELMQHLKAMGIAADGPHSLTFKAHVAKTLGGVLVETEFSQVSVRYACDEENMALLIHAIMEIEAGHPATKLASVDPPVVSDSPVIVEPKTKRR